MLHNHGIQHLACIMDGNRRWAKERGLQAWIGHAEGAKKIQTPIEFCLKNNIPHLTLWALSIDNLSRSQEELQYLFALIEQKLMDESSPEMQQLLHHGIRVQCIGDEMLIPEKIKNLCKQLEQKTAHNNTLTVTFLLCYGGRQEYVALAQACKDMHTSTIDEQTVRNALWTHALPDVDIVVRTGKVQRLSGFLPFHTAYSELVFLDKYWPEITEQDLIDIAQNYMLTHRRFGK